MRDRSSDIVEDIFLPGQAHLLGGSSGSGKTAFEIWLESHVLRGESFLGRATNPPTWWGIFVTDRDMGARMSFWQQAGMEPLPYYCITEDSSLTPKVLYTHADTDEWSDYELLKRGIDKLKPPPGGVLTIDVANFFTGDPRQGYSKSFAKGWALNKLARDLSITMLCIMHGGKQRRFDSYVRMVDRIIASSGFLGSVGTISYLASPEETGQGASTQDFVWQSHHAASETFRLRRTSAGLFEMVEKLEGQPKEAEKEAHRSERWEVYLPWIPPEGASNYMPTMEILRKAELLQIPKRSVERDLEAMEKAGLLVRWKGQRGKWQASQSPGEGS